MRLRKRIRESLPQNIVSSGVNSNCGFEATIKDASDEFHSGQLTICENVSVKFSPEFSRKRLALPIFVCAAGANCVVAGERSTEMALPIQMTSVR